MTLRHPEVARLSLARYLEHLENADLPDNPPLRNARAALIAALKLVDSHPDRLREGDIEFNAGLLTSPSISDQSSLINEFTLGSGNDAAPVIAMGTEEGYDPASGELAIWTCAGALLALTDSPLPLVQRLASGMPAGPWTQAGAVTSQSYAPYHRNPIRWARLVDAPIALTWRVLSHVVSAPSVEGLDDSCYQIERSAAVSKNASRGRPPSSERVAFLVELVTAFRDSARVLLLHGNVRWAGTPIDPADIWNEANRRISEAFLQTDDIGEGVQETIGSRPYRVRVFRRGSHTVLWTWAPGARLSREYRDRLRLLVNDALSQG